MLTDKIALVTGAARGIGRAIAERLLADGAIVFINDLFAADVEKTVTELSSTNTGKVFGIASDISTEEGSSAAINAPVEKFGRIDLLVNNAGITRDGLVMRMSLADWEKVIHVNLTGTFLCSKAASRKMLSQKSGRIINISSVVGVMGNAGQANYASSKAAVIGLTKSLAKEFGSRGVTVNAIAPGYIETPMTHVLSEEVRQNFMKSIPLQRAGTPEDVAGAVAFLAGPSSAYITGQVLHVDGGMVM
ncbi:MAG: 3-oxoacyl-[acyl-carrier-protein] reductase [bacterium]|nr:3-oxoacyl-[acyl-carrier-protein] reductase [bacterium]